MTSQGRTIQIFLPDGNPRGIRLAEITSRTVQVLQIPRAHFDDAANRSGLEGPGIYFLIADSNDGTVPRLYLGEAEDCIDRLKQHHKQKEFWSIALAASSKTRFFTKGHVKWLEWYCHKLIAEASRYALENAAAPTEPYVSEPVKADLLDNFDTMRTLIGTLGFPLFDPLVRVSPAAQLICKGRDAEARGEYTEDGLVVLMGSTANLQEAPSSGVTVRNIRRRLLEAGVFELEGKVYRFTRNHVFSAPSAAASAVLARRANGWIEWRYPDGRTLDEVVRQ